jgi:xanthine phosphoribosyltransferase
MSDEDFIYTPEMFLFDMQNLTTKIRKENFEVILAIARGGMTLGTTLANRLDIELYIIQIKSYDGQSQKSIKIIREPDWNCLINKKVLVVDDLIDNGTSMNFVRRLLVEHNVTNFKIAVLIDKKKNPAITVDFCERFVNQWVRFFWENDYNE